MLTEIFANIGYGYTAMLVITALVCMAVNDDACFEVGVSMCLLSIIGNIPEIWNSPPLTFGMHLMIYPYMMLTITGKYSDDIKAMLGLMIFADFAWILIRAMPPTNLPLAFPHALFWWQSCINIFFTVICVLAVRKCYFVYLEKKAT